MSPQESLRLKCLQLAIDTRGYGRPGTGLIAAATAIEDYVTGKHAELSPAQEEAVRNIVAEQLATMFDGADRRIREAMFEASVRGDQALKDILGRISIDAAGNLTGVTAPVDEAPGSPSVTPRTVGEVLEKLQPVSPPADHLDPRPLAGNPA